MIIILRVLSLAVTALSCRAIGVAGLPCPAHSCHEEIKAEGRKHYLPLRCGPFVVVSVLCVVLCALCCVLFAVLSDVVGG